jgi:hypothetical protein
MSDPVKNFQAEVDQVFAAAIKSAKGGDATWNSLLTSYSIMPLTDQQKEALLKSEMKIAGGAFPIEVRWVLQAIVMKHASFAANAENKNVQNLLLSYNMDAEVMKYYTRIKPFNGMADIFKNAKTTTKNYSEGIGEARKSAIRCKNCGAPRLEEMQYDNCMFCGSELFENNN